MEGLGGAFFGEEVGEAAAELAGVVADDVVFDGAVGWGAVEDADADGVLGDVPGAVEQTFRNYIEEEAGEQGGADEVAAGDDALGELPAGVVLRESRARAGRVRRRWEGSSRAWRSTTDVRVIALSFSWRGVWKSERGTESG